MGNVDDEQRLGEWSLSVAGVTSVSFQMPGRIPGAMSSDVSHWSLMGFVRT